MVMFSLARSLLLLVSPTTCGAIEANQFLLFGGPEFSGPWRHAIEELAVDRGQCALRTDWGRSGSRVNRICLQGQPRSSSRETPEEDILDLSFARHFENADRGGNADPVQLLPPYAGVRYPMPAGVDPRLGLNISTSHDRPLHSHAQYQQDGIIKELFHGKRGGFFVDLAAAEAVHLSNTRMLERDLGWSGVLIEPNPLFWPRLMRRSSRSALIGAVVGATSGETVQFALWDGHGVQEMSATNLNGGHRPRAAMLGGGVHGHPTVKTDNDGWKLRGVDVGTTSHFKTVSLQRILERLGAPREIDYVSLDVEGFEHETLRNFDFCRFRIAAFTIERPKPSLKRLLRDKGFVHRTSVFADEPKKNRFFHGEELWVQAEPQHRHCAFNDTGGVVRAESGGRNLFSDRLQESSSGGAVHNQLPFASSSEKLPGGDGGPAVLAAPQAGFSPDSPLQRLQAHRQKQAERWRQAAAQHLSSVGQSLSSEHALVSSCSDKDDGDRKKARSGLEHDVNLNHNRRNLESNTNDSPIFLDENPMLLNSGYVAWSNLNITTSRPVYHPHGFFSKLFVYLWAAHKLCDQGEEPDTRLFIVDNLRPIHARATIDFYGSASDSQGSRYSSGCPESVFRKSIGTPAAGRGTQRGDHHDVFAHQQHDKYTTLDCWFLPLRNSNLPGPDFGDSTSSTGRQICEEVLFKFRAIAEKFPTSFAEFHFRSVKEFYRPNAELERFIDIATRRFQSYINVGEFQAGQGETIRQTNSRGGGIFSEKDNCEGSSTSGSSRENSASKKKVLGLHIRQGDKVGVEGTKKLSPEHVARVVRAKAKKHGCSVVFLMTIDTELYGKDKLRPLLPTDEIESIVVFQDISPFIEAEEGDQRVPDIGGDAIHDQSAAVRRRSRGVRGSESWHVLVETFVMARISEIVLVALASNVSRWIVALRDVKQPYYDFDDLMISESPSVKKKPRGDFDNNSDVSDNVKLSASGNDAKKSINNTDTITMPNSWPVSWDRALRVEARRGGGPTKWRQHDREPGPHICLSRTNNAYSRTLPRAALLGLTCAPPDAPLCDGD